MGVPHWTTARGRRRNGLCGVGAAREAGTQGRTPGREGGVARGEGAWDARREWAARVGLTWGLERRARDKLRSSEETTLQG